MSLRADVQKVEDYEGIVSYGIMRTPGLVIDEKIVWQGGVPSVLKIQELIRDRLAEVGAQ